MQKVVLTAPAGIPMLGSVEVFMPRMLRLFPLCLIVSVIISLQTAPAQQPAFSDEVPPVSARHFPSKPMHRYHILGGFWRADHTYTSYLQLRNVVETHSLSVSATLYFEDGHAEPLDAVELAPGGTKRVDLSAAARRLRPSATFGSVSLDYQWFWNGAVDAEIIHADPTRSFSFSSHFVNQEYVKVSANTDHRFEGLWWLRSETTNGYIRITNTKASRVAVRVAVGDGPDLQIGSEVPLAAHESTILSLRDVLTAAGLSGKSGGLQVSWSGAKSDLVVDGGLFDESKGFSARLPISVVDPDRSRQTSEPVTQASVGMMVGHPDADMMFPSEVSFHPYLVLRNVASEERNVSLAVNYMFGQPVTKGFVSLRLRAGETRIVNIERVARGS